MLGVQVPPGLPVFPAKGLMIMEKIKLIVDKALQFLSQAKAELKKVTWPTRKQTLASTAVVMVIVAIMAIYLGMVDFVLAKIVKWILG